MGSSWRLLVHQATDGFTNMAIDEAILQANAFVGAVPTLRLYRWHPACVSLGYFQSAAEVDIDECRSLGIDCVRRPTGGRAILHDAELTYSIVAPIDDARVSGTVVESYRKISAALLEGLRELDVPAEMKPRCQPANQLSSPAGDQARDQTRCTSTAACFDLPSDYEITSNGRKLVGSAQMRQAGVILQHGSLLMEIDAEQTFSVLRPPEGSDRKHVIAWLAGRVTSLYEVLHRRVTFDEVAAAIAKGFASSFGLPFIPGELTTAERHLADTLRDEKYCTDAWNFKPIAAHQANSDPKPEE